MVVFMIVFRVVFRVEIRVVFMVVFRVILVVVFIFVFMVVFRGLRFQPHPINPSLLKSYKSIKNDNKIQWKHIYPHPNFSVLRR